MDLALNTLQRLICHKAQQTKQTSSAEMQSVYSTAPADWATKTLVVCVCVCMGGSYPSVEKHSVYSTALFSRPTGQLLNE